MKTILLLIGLFSFNVIAQPDIVAIETQNEMLSVANVKLESEVQELRAKLRTCEEEQERLMPLSRTNIPENVFYRDHNPEHNKVTYHFRTVGSCKGKATLYNTEQIAIASKTVYSVADNIYFDFNLFPETQYSVKLEILDYRGEPIKQFTKNSVNHPKEMLITTPSTPTGANYDLKVVPVDNTLEVSIKSEKKFLYKITCFERRSPDKLEFNPIGKPLGSDFKKDKLNRYVDEFKTNEVKEIFKDLKLNTEYKVVAEIVDASGKNDPLVETKKTQGEQFDFDGPVKFDFGTLKNTISWKATGNPTSGKMTIRSPESVGSVPIPAKVELDPKTKTFTAELPELEALSEILEGKMKKEKALGETQYPILDLSMTDVKGAQKKLSVKIAFTLPTLNEIDEAKKSGIIDKNEKEELIKIVKKLSERKDNTKIKWGEIVSTGLPFLLTIL